MKHIIDVRPHRGRFWKAFEAPGVQPYYIGPNGKDHAIDYATQRLAARVGLVRVWNAAGVLERSIETDPIAQRI